MNILYKITDEKVTVMVKYRDYTIQGNKIIFNDSKSIRVSDLEEVHVNADEGFVIFTTSPEKIGKYFKKVCKLIFCNSIFI